MTADIRRPTGKIIVTEEPAAKASDQSGRTTTKGAAKRARITAMMPSRCSGR